MARTIRAVCSQLLVVALGGTLLLGCRGCQSASPPAQQESASKPSRGGELVASLRSEPGTYNRHAEASAATALLTLLTHAPLVRINRATDALEPWLAESWTQSPGADTYTLKLRPGVRFSDGTPLTSADVLFSFKTTYDEKANSQLADPMRPGGRPFEVTAPDASTIVIRIPQSGRALGLRLLDSLPILPRHKLEAALNEGRFAGAWRVGTPLSEIAGLGPFVLSEHVAGQRMVFTRNPHYWRKDVDGVQLPYLDRLTVAIVPLQDTEAIRVESGEIDVMSNGDIRPDDYSAFKRAADQGRLRLIEGGIGVDPNMLWFNLAPSGPARKKPWLLRKEFRQAISFAVDRQAVVDTVYLGEAVPIYGPISPGNRTWHSASAPSYPHDVAKARELLAAARLVDRNGDGMLEDAGGAPARFSILTQRGHTIRERTASVVQEHLRQVGVGVDIVALDPPSMFQRFGKGDYESIYFGFQASETDPAAQGEFWFSSGRYHVWNPGQRAPATDWERRIDELMRQQMSSSDVAERQRLVAEAQRIFGEELPAIYIAAPRTVLAVSRRVVNPQPSVLIPQLLWSADTLAVSAPRQ